jgi:hypothetical protein
MNNRTYVRYGSAQLPDALGKVSVSWQDTSITLTVVDYSAQGISVVIPPLDDGLQIPAIDDTVKVALPAHNAGFTGTCIHLRTEPDGSTTLGLFFADPKEQQELRTLLFKALNSVTAPCRFVSYQWEELVGKLCNSDDPKLKQLGHQHLAQMKAHQPDLQH